MTRTPMTARTEGTRAALDGADAHRARYENDVKTRREDAT
ncbi:hypothetical protein STRAU_1363 [Streptomyces aurantiacus JA 4570]|uniref:Uncharacterized protein n=1 Tax=Streptomyces aurantiacus JA 4570 TaxID=1286094 RepID=S4AVR7_9ACTN|nr:hypothetical protein STRAU_1363 [Streptomyces aurantiacus JA 4570]